MTRLLLGLYRYKGWIWSLMLLAGVAFVGMLLLHEYGLASIENTWFELALLLYCMAIPLCCIQWGRKLLESGSPFGTAFSALGGASFGIYLVHPALLTLWDRIAPAQEQHLAVRSTHGRVDSHRPAWLLAARMALCERTKKGSAI